ncbi:MAG: hypothetical protein Q9174_002150 [Haloplaca sp. 1 TL-2023]
MSGRRQPVRQTRTNPSRNATLPGPQRVLGASRTTQDGVQDAEIGFFPAITHFTDSISALPKEMVRHYSMLKEVDAKICGPEEIIGQLIANILRLPSPPRKPTLTQQTTDTSRSEIETAPSTARTADNISLKSVPSRVEAASTATQENEAEFDFSRRRLFHQLRVYMKEMLPVLDEKNHVLSTAGDCLDNQLRRCTGSYRQLDNELDEEARWGSMTHWAYAERTTEKRGAMAGDRSKREAAAANHLAATAPAVQEAEGAALRSELRREAMAARKHGRNQYLESDFDDSRAASQAGAKKAYGPGKGRKAADTMLPNQNNAASHNGLSGAAPPSKRRKTEKTTLGPGAGGPPAARAMNSVYGANPNTQRGAGTSPRGTPGPEPPKRRGRGGAAMMNGIGRKRANTNTSATNSPSMATSPVAGTFTISKDIHRRSPAASLMQRIPSSRGRQNSAQGSMQEARNRPTPTASVKSANGNGAHSLAMVEADKTAASTGVTPTNTKLSAKSTSNLRSERPFGEDGASDDVPGPESSVESRNTDKPLKKEALDVSMNGSRSERPRSISISTRGGGKTSKTSTPTQGSFTEVQRTRPVRNSEPAKRSHKKGAGLAAQQAAAQRVHDEDASSMQGDEDDEGESEPRYCYCNNVSYGEMVGCDMAGCPREWFHLDCVGLTKAPKGNAKWYCEECKETLKKRKPTED